MQRHWILTYLTESGGNTIAEAHELESEASFGQDGDDSFLVRFIPDENIPLRTSGTAACILGHKLLWREGLLRKSMTIRFNEKGLPGNLHGQSSDLIFALATIIRGYRKPLAFTAIAATGVLRETYEVVEVGGIKHKLKAALRTVPPGGIVFYPDANNPEVDADLIEQAQKREIEFMPVARLDQAVTRLGIPQAHMWSGSPFRGLEPFEKKHHAIYFGRSKEVRVVCNQLIERAAAGQPGVLILGASGAGKSSFVQAGVLPTLIYESEDSNFDWQVWKPQMAEPRNEAGLYQSILRNWAEVPALSRLKQGSTKGNLLDIIGHLVRNQVDGRKFIWVVDQLEELFTLNFSTEAVHAFGEFIIQMQKADIWVIATLRNDFYQPFVAIESLLKFFEETGHYNLQAIKKDALREVIDGPAKVANFQLEKEGSITLADRILTDIGSSEELLPLLEFTLHELFQRRDQEKNLLTFRAYDEIGGIKGAIGQAAEQALGKYEPELHKEFPPLLRALVRVAEKNGKRDTAKVINLEKAFFSQETLKLIDRLVAHRLLILSGDKGGQQLRVAHEALFSHWPLAQKVLNESRQFLLIRDRLIQAAQIWEESGHDKSRLLATGLPLNEGCELLEQEFASELHSENKLLEFIQASVRADQERIAELNKGAKFLQRAMAYAKKQTVEALVLIGLVNALFIACVNLAWDNYENKRRNYAQEVRTERIKTKQLKDKINQYLTLEANAIATQEQQIKKIEQLITAHEATYAPPSEGALIAKMKESLKQLKEATELRKRNQQEMKSSLQNMARTEP